MDDMGVGFGTWKIWENHHPCPRCNNNEGRFSFERPIYGKIKIDDEFVLGISDTLEDIENDLIKLEQKQSELK